LSDKSDRLERAEGNGEERKGAEKNFDEKRLLGGYRELIGSLYESWTIGIERVYK